MSDIKLPPLPAPDSFLFQHEDTGQTMFVDAQQVEWGFEANNPRLQKVSGAFTEKQLNEYARAAVQANAPDVPEDGFTVNFVVHAGLDKTTARKCEAIVRDLLSAIQKG